MRILLLLPLLAGARQEPAVELVPGESRRISLAFEEPRGPCVIACVATAPLVLYAACEAEGLDPAITASVAGAETLGSSSEASPARAFLRIELAGSARVELTIRSGDPSSGSARLALHAVARLDVARRSGHAEALRLTGEARRAREAGQASDARELALEALERVLELDPAASCDETLAALLDLGRELIALQDCGAARRALELVCAHAERVYPAAHLELARARERLGIALVQTGELRRARDLLERSLAAFESALPDGDLELARSRLNLTSALQSLGESDAALAQAERAVASLERGRPPGDHELLIARLNLGMALRPVGQLARARTVLEEVIAAFERTLPPEHFDLLRARMALSSTAGMLGDLAVARAQAAAVIEAGARALPEDHPDLLRARANLALCDQEEGDDESARRTQEEIVEVLSRRRDADDLELQGARTNLANTLSKLGELRRARGLEEQVLVSLRRSLPPEHPEIAAALVNHSATLFDLGDAWGALGIRREVVETLAREFPEDHPTLLIARGALARSLKEVGQFDAALRIGEELVELWSRTRSDDDLDLQAAQLDLAAVLSEVGDLAASRAITEALYAIRLRTLPDDHPRLQTVRHNLAVILHAQGEFERAAELLERVVAVLSAREGDQAPDLQTARLGLAVSRSAQGRIEEARELLESVVEARERSLPPDHPLLLAALHDLAGALLAAGDPVGALALEEQVLERGRAVLGDENPLQLELARGLFACALGLGDDEAIVRRGRELAELLERRSRAETGMLAPRECEERAARRAAAVSELVACARPELADSAFRAVASARAVGLRAAWAARASAGDPGLEALRAEVRERSAEIARRATSERGLAGLDAAVRERERVQRALLERSRSAGAQPLDAEALRRRLPAGAAAAIYVRYERERGETPALAVLATAASGPTVLLDLGPLAEIDAAVDRWRSAVMAPIERGIPAAAARESAELEAGETLRKLALDPVLAATGEPNALFVCLDDVLHAVPLDALPEGNERIGDRLRIAVRPAFVEHAALEVRAGGGLLAIGDVDYDLAPEAVATEAIAVDGVEGVSDAAPEPELAARSPRERWERVFLPLVETGAEARAIAALHARSAPEEEAVVLEGGQATAESLRAHTSGARWLHVATHGYFAPGAVPSPADPPTRPATRGWAPLGARERVHGFSPMALCGLALAGANRAPDELGRIAGCLTAEELATMDLGACRLAVLSACDTHAGVRRAGQGVASLQKALHMAGARAVITSLWKVPDEATRELMVDFYRRLWVEKKPAHEALWQAKARLRSARDEKDRPTYATRDWAGWVLSEERD